MTEKERIDCLRLIRSKGIGCITYHALVKEVGSEESALLLLSKQGRDVFSEKKALAEIKEHEAIGATLITYHDANYPPLLKHISDSPPVLSILGNPEALSSPMVAIVGSRSASMNAIKFTQNLAYQLRDAGYGIISGLARGIDGAAHDGAMKCTTGGYFSTIAVMAGGVDCLYPPEHGWLREKIMEKGALISEMPLGRFPGASHFPRRNRLISGLAKAICIIEAAKPSGSLITANYALDQGRELFAVPGFPGDPRSVGTNSLLKNGAHILESAADVVNIIGYPIMPIETLPNTTQQKNIPPTDNLNTLILQCLSVQPLSMEELFASVNIVENTLHDALLTLELQGHIHRDQRGYITRVF
ncbi:MAG: DNA-processing protein DprA [Alphaproteobacteria bacterium]|nr:DNA-processing protein DprA [Alphaproteobacteria bacterium]